MLNSPIYRRLALHCCLVLTAAALCPSKVAAAGDNSLSFLAETTDAGGAVVDLTLDLTVADRSRIDFGLGYADSAWRDGANATFGQVGFAHDFDGAWVRIGIDYRDDAEVLSSLRGEAAIELYRGAWALGLTGGLTRTDFDPLRVDTVVRLRDRAIAVRAEADCEIEGQALALRLARAGERWATYVSTQLWRWEDTACRFDAPGLAALANTGRQAFVQLAGALSDRLARNAVAHSNQASSLLGHTVGVGLARQGENWILGVDGQVGEDAYLEERFTAWTLWARRPLTRALTFGLFAGVSENALESQVFAGVEFSRAF